MPQRPLAYGPDGILRSHGDPIAERYAVLPSNVSVAGTKVASTQLEGAEQPTLDLWRLEQPPRLRDVKVGLQPNGDVYDEATLRAYGCTSGSFVVTLLGKTTEEVRILLDDREVRRIPLEDGQAETVTVAASPERRDGRAVCTLTLRPSSTLGTTRFDFARG